MEAYNAEQKRKAASKGTSSPKGKAKAKGKGSSSTTSKNLVLAGDEPQEVFAPHLETGEKVLFVIDLDGTTTVKATGATYKTPRKAGVAAGVWPVDRLQTWKVLRYTDSKGEERLADELRASPKGYKLGEKKAKKAKAKASPSGDLAYHQEKAKAKLEKLQASQEKLLAKFKAAQEELAKLQG